MSAAHDELPTWAPQPPLPKVGEIVFRDGVAWRCVSAGPDPRIVAPTPLGETRTGR